jgi:hypothetical protein
VDPSLTLLNRQGSVFEENGVNGELSLLSNETSSNTQSTNTSSIVVSNDPQLSLGRHSLDLLDELSLVSVEEVVDNDIGVSSSGRTEAGVKFLATTTLWPAGSCWTWTSWAERASSLEANSWTLREKILLPRREYQLKNNI